ncbi:superoxide dismutase family protein [Oceanobacillus caeni]|uniref:superoxide dismutase family protein n=1 Tax=Oceanobacillus caeni TaxID=405946 RepID=UPI000620E4D4|nr:superoxide dismutase family protein [Oceanobacillus caeni]KKE79241.1 superoxide dismutase [Bacilli bacterium VT-13-104]PZD86790.1 superoxide dismutase family protein [Bacilli bacterium]MCR1834108.1 superoxide dismutase family protein [Oceanobacillus caeni]PZD88164.1 superoxide dismutase family protein [Bacilli bacterium]PZD91441.1 superoxide dismutase family protein [Bacilli bacterium]
MKRFILLMFLTSTVLMACNQTTQDKEENRNSQEPEHQEVNSTVNKNVLVDLKNSDGEVVANVSLLESESGGVNISIKGENLPPGGHGFHIHENGSCIAPTFESAGAHFNPTGKKHGFENPEGPHAGDLKNINVGENGKLSIEALADMVTLEKGKKNSLLKEGGTSLVIHSDPDDYVSQPAGNAGDRIACGVIE